MYTILHNTFDLISQRHLAITFHLSSVLNLYHIINYKLPKNKRKTRMYNKNTNLFLFPRGRKFEKKKEEREKQEIGKGIKKRNRGLRVESKNRNEDV